MVVVHYNSHGPPIIATTWTKENFGDDEHDNSRNLRSERPDDNHNVITTTKRHMSFPNEKDNCPTSKGDYKIKCFHSHYHNGNLL